MATDRWQGLLDAARDAYVSIGADGRVLEWNRQAETLFGWSRDEAHGKLLASLIVPPEFRDAHLLGLQRFVAAGEGRVVFQRLQLPALHRSGRRLELEFTIWPSRDPGDDWRFHAFLHDVGEERRQQAYLRLLQDVASAANETDDVERAVRRALDAIRAATGTELGHAHLVDGSDGGVLAPTGWWSPAPVEPLASATANRRFPHGIGLPGRVLTDGRAHWIADFEDDDNYPRADAATASGFRSTFAFPISTGERTVAVLEFFAPQVGEPDPGLLEVLETVGRQLGRVFERFSALRELELAAEEREEIVSIVSHELRGPLATTQAAADLLSAELADTATETSVIALELLERELSRLGRMVNDLLTAQRLDSRSLRPHPREVALAPAVRRVASDVGLDDVRWGSTENLAVSVDPDHLTQMLWNLLANARAHGRPPVTLTAELDPGGASVTLVVADTGEGVPASVVPRLFDRFARGGQSTGSGLGLAIARGLAQANGGDVRYRGPAEGGPAFQLTLLTAGTA